MSRQITLAALAISGLALCSGARADVQLTERGPVAFLTSSRLQPGDEQTLSEFLARPRPEPIRIIYLDSPGGNTQTAIAIGRLIRSQGIDTAFHVGRGRCASACTTMFLGGVHRYYIDGAGVPDGVATRLGLGFHPSTGGRRAEGMINEYYQEMGVPGAAGLRYHVYSRESVGDPSGEGGPRRLFFAGGNSALHAGVATSIDEPRDSALRD